MATTALAFFICTFGMLSYLVASYLFNDTFYAVFIPFLLLTGTVVVFGWWISNEVVSPVERVSLLAKSLERGMSNSVPKTSGSAETDELMETMVRISRQTQKLVSSMDEVAQGNLDVVLSHGENSDKITTTFQKLLAKVTESIHAKQELTQLQTTLSKLTEEVSSIRRDNLNVTVSTDADETREVGLALNHLIEQLSETVLQVKTSSMNSQKISLEINSGLQSLIRKDEDRIAKMNQASITLRKVPQIVEKISEEIAQSAFSATQSIQTARNGTNVAQANLNAVANLRKQIHESIKRIQKLTESSQEIGKIAKTVEDLAQRTSMVALNASIQAVELNENGRGFAIVSEEVERLAKRANDTNKSISSLNKSIQSEINKVESSLENTVSEVANLSKFALETTNAIAELERYVTQFLGLQEKISSYTLEQNDDAERAFETFVASISETEESVRVLKQSADSVQRITNSMDGLQISVSHVKVSSADSRGAQRNSLPSPIEAPEMANF